jgi:DNA-binding transcriptional MerR regulator
LLNPYREEQNGRLYFRFTEEDVAALERIALLRQAGFSIGRIGEMQKDPAAIAPAVRELGDVLRQQRQEAEEAERVLLQAETCPDLDALVALLGDKREVFPPPEPRFDRFDLLSEEERQEAVRLSREGLAAREKRKGLLLNLGSALVLAALAVLLTLAFTGQLKRTAKPAGDWMDRFLTAETADTLFFRSAAGAEPVFTGLDGATNRPAAVFSVSEGRFCLSWKALGDAQGELLESMAEGELIPWEEDPDSPGLAAYFRGAEGWYALYAQGESMDRTTLANVLARGVTLVLREEGQPERELTLTS